MSDFTITKSDFLIGRQCDRRLWLRKRGTRPEPEVEPDEVWDIREVEGARVEELVAARYADSVRVAPFPEDELTPLDEESSGQRVAASLQALRDRRPLFQAHLRSGNFLAVADILEPTENGGWFLWEVKASTSPKVLNDHDLAFQVEVARRAGLEIAGAGLWLLNKEYVRQGDLDLNQLLVRQDRTTEVDALRDSTSVEMQRQLGVLECATMPGAVPSSHCKAGRAGKDGDRPSSCGHLLPNELCRKELPDHWVGEIPLLKGRKADRAYHLDPPDILGLDEHDPDWKWTSMQSTVIAGTKSGQPWINAARLRAELDRLVFPVAYVDFEFDTSIAVPRFSGTWPYARLPFQWSMFIQESESSELQEAGAFLWDKAADPRPHFLDSLLSTLPDSGSIVVHHRAAEKSVLGELARSFPDRHQEIDAIISRLYDTIDLLKAGYYHPRQRGSFSIKKVAPALLNRGYEDLDIQDGLAAVVAWQKLIALPQESPERPQIRRSLLQYCGMDTHLMHDIVDAIRQLVS